MPLDNHEPSQDSSTGGAQGPLHGVRVLDLTSIVLGPLATRILGDYGADVVKLEGPSGDLTRSNGAVRASGSSSMFLALNRNKKSIAVDLKRPEGRDIAMRLVAGADVLVHNIRVAAMERLGLGYEACRAVNPRLVYVAATGFGQDGPYRDRPAFDDIMQAACGMAGLVNQQHGRPEFMPTLIADKTAGLAVAHAVLAALFHRERCGQGQYVEVPMFETMVDFTLVEHMGGASFEPPSGPAGYQRILSGGRRLLATRDGFMAALPYSVVQWRSFFQAIDRGDVMDRLQVNVAADVNAKSGLLYSEMAAAMPTRTTAEWLDLFGRLDIAATAMYSLQDLLQHPQLEDVGLFQRDHHPTQGAIVTVRPTTRMSATPLRVRQLAPDLGLHTEELLSEVGYTEAETESLIERGIAGSAAVSVGSPARGHALEGGTA